METPDLDCDLVFLVGQVVMNLGWNAAAANGWGLLELLRLLRLLRLLDSNDEERRLVGRLPGAARTAYLSPAGPRAGANS